MKLDVDLLNYCGADARKWAAEFRQAAISTGYSDMEEGWLIDWFTKAIQTSVEIKLKLYKSLLEKELAPFLELGTALNNYNESARKHHAVNSPTKDQPTNPETHLG